ncbi:FadR/GntR family transcriptional regulator [uncultured Jatrophihabitans sp.]|uniref:FadR/GntR family transcriptional regulator n=1 Tax=uncultured Jatrophihabitans sp. TaxID=1610747 RepID=UPI0035CA1A98
MSEVIEPVRRLKVADAVAAQLEELISAGKYAVGERLPAERTLAEQFGVGRSSMREALRIVESAGLVRTDHGIGVFVVRTARDGGLASLMLLDDVTVEDLFQVRQALERDAAAHAARRRNDEALAGLRKLITQMGRRDVTNSDFVQMDAQLHLAIAAATGNPLFPRLMHQLEPLFLTYSHRVIEMPGRRRNAHAGHKEIVDAIGARRPRDASSAALRHIRSVEADIVAHIAGD